MTLIFSLLRDDHIIFAADRRQVRGYEDARYRTDDCWKTEAILGNTAMLGFAGHDSVEQVVEPLKRNGDLERGSIGQVARNIGTAAREIIKGFPQDAMPAMEFLVTGFSLEGGKNVATSFVLTPETVFMPTRYSFMSGRGHDNFTLIGRHRHGAFYIFLKCVREMCSIDAGILSDHPEPANDDHLKTGQRRHPPGH
jgi:hypothetical protein